MSMVLWKPLDYLVAISVLGSPCLCCFLCLCCLCFRRCARRRAARGKTSTRARHKRPEKRDRHRKKPKGPKVVRDSSMQMVALEHASSSYGNYEEDDLLPAGWEKLYDEDHGEYYYYNEATGETSWDPPDA